MFTSETEEDIHETCCQELELRSKNLKESKRSLKFGYEFVNIEFLDVGWAEEMASLGAKFSFDNQDLQEKQLKQWPHMGLVGSSGVDIHAIKQISEEKTHVFSDKDESPVQIIKKELDWLDVFDDESVKLKSKECLWKHGISESKGGSHVNKQNSEDRLHKYESFQANQFMEDETGRSQVVGGETFVKLRTEGLQKYRNYGSKEVINLVNKQRWEEKTQSFDAHLGSTDNQEDNLLDHHIRENEHDRHSDTDIRFPYDGMLYTEQMAKHDKSSNMLILIIQFITSYVRSAFQLFLRSVLVCYHCIFSLNMNFDIPKVKINGFEKKNMKVYNEKANSGLDRISLVKPKTVTRGVKNIAFGFITAIYVVIMLSILFVTAFMFSFLVVKSLIYEPVNLNKELYFDYTKDRPVASISFEETKMYSTTETILRRVSLPARRFHATIFLTLPESDFNKKLGIFQVCHNYKLILE